MARPNVVVITCHDLGDYLGCYGTPVQTPHIDRLAAEGALFRNHFSTSSVCSPARGAIVTGCYPHTHGLMGLVHRGWELDVETCPPLPTLLGEAGYETRLFGFQHEHWDPARLGYQHTHRGESTHCDHVAPLFTEWLGQRAEGDVPFLAAIGWAETHRMGLRPSGFKRDVYEPADPAEVEVRPYLPDLPEMREDLADFYGAIKLVDRCVGDVVGALDAAGLGDDTIVVFTSDHGASFMHSKATLYDGGAKVALAMRWPGGMRAGVCCEHLTSHVDILPTLFDLIGLPVPDHVQGRSMAQICREGALDAPRRHVFAEKNVTNYYDPTRMARSPRFKYIRKGLRTCIFDFIIPELELCTCGFRQNRAVFDFYSARRTTEEFYDLARDPGELDNLIDDPHYQGAVAELRAALDAHLEATDDPFRHLNNPILLPADVYPKVRGPRKR